MTLTVAGGKEHHLMSHILWGAGDGSELAAHTHTHTHTSEQIFKSSILMSPGCSYHKWNQGDRVVSGTVSPASQRQPVMELHTGAGVVKISLWL
jgi:hypothetical protein